jgi:hypothetical protein
MFGENVGRMERLETLFLDLVLFSVFPSLLLQLVHMLGRSSGFGACILALLLLGIPKLLFILTNKKWCYTEECVYTKTFLSGQSSKPQI